MDSQKIIPYELNHKVLLGFREHLKLLLNKAYHFFFEVSKSPKSTKASSNHAIGPLNRFVTDCASSRKALRNVLLPELLAPTSIFTGFNLINPVSLRDLKF